MASKTLITPEQYLATYWEREPEYVHGEIVEKPLPSKKHGYLQLLIGSLLRPVGFAATEVRSRLEYDVFRLPDVALWRKEPDGDPPAEPPLVAVEIASPDDRMSNLMLKFEQYRTWGVEYIWFVEPELAKLYVFDGGLKEVTQFELAEFKITITPDQLFS